MDRERAGRPRSELTATAVAHARLQAGGDLLDERTGPLLGDVLYWVRRPSTIDEHDERADEAGRAPVLQLTSVRDPDGDGDTAVVRPIGTGGGFVRRLSS